MIWPWALGLFVTYWVWRFLPKGSGRRVKPGYKYRPMQLIVGTPGMGKSYTLTFRALESLAAGRHVRLNFGLRPDRVFIALRLRFRLSEEDARAAIGRISYFRTWEDYVDAYELDAYIDEAQDVYRATDWNSIPSGFITWNAQHRHRRCNIILAAHRFGAVQNYVRDGLITNIYLAKPANGLAVAFRKVTGGGKYPLIQLLNIKNADEETLPSAQQRKGIANGMSRAETVPVDPRVANCYDHEGGVFMSPLDADKRAKGKDTVSAINPRRVVDLASVPADGLPCLDVAERVDLMKAGASAGDALRARWSDGSGVPLLGYAGA